MNLTTRTRIEGEISSFRSIRAAVVRVISRAPAISSAKHHGGLKQDQQRQPHLAEVEADPVQQDDASSRRFRIASVT
jgi:hypothetical protein